MPPKFTPNQPQAGRYWPGKPLQEDHESSSSDEEYEDDEEEQQEQVKPPKAVPDSQYTSKLVTTMKSTSISEAGPYVAPEEESSEDESEDEDENAGSLQPGQRSSKARQAHRRAIGDFVATDGVNLEESEDEEESEEEESEEESEDEQPLRKPPMLRPTFVPRNQRDVSNGGNNKPSNSNGDNPADAISSKEAQALKFLQTERQNAAQAAYEAELNSETNRGIESIDDTDDLDPEAEKAAWKLRELHRLKRDREALIARELEREEIEQRRNMDESERLKEDYALKRQIEEEREKSRGKMEFMQKYYHKGAFYQDQEILKRDYNVATHEEHHNKVALPKSLQIRSGELGRASRTKWTHLSAEDTSGKQDSAWFDRDSNVNKRTVTKMGGMHDGNEHERKRNKR